MIKKVIILIITSICFFLFPQCKDSDDDGGKSISSVKITILPDKELIVEAIGGEKEFTITSEPSTSLKFAYSTSWIKPVTGKETAWMIEENKSELSRNGRIYILDASSLKGLDTIYITQKSVSGEINDNEVVFIETEVPVSIPFAGNSYISYPKNSNLIDNYTGKLVSGWVDKDIIISTYFRVGGFRQTQYRILRK